MRRFLRVSRAISNIMCWCIPSTMSFLPRMRSSSRPMTNQPGSNVQVSLKAQGRSGFELRNLRYGTIPGRGGAGSARRRQRRGYGWAAELPTIVAPAVDSANRLMRRTVLRNIAGTFSERCSRCWLAGASGPMSAPSRKRRRIAPPLLAAAPQPTAPATAIAAGKRRRATASSGQSFARRAEGGAVHNWRSNASRESSRQRSTTALALPWSRR